MNRHDRTVGVPKDVFGDAAQEQPAHAGAAVGSHHDEVGLLFRGAPLRASFARLQEDWPCACVERVRSAVGNAVSVASVLLLTEGTLTELPEPKAAPRPSPELG